MEICLPANFTPAHRAAVLRFVQGRPVDDDQRATPFEAFDLLHRATASDDTLLAALPNILPTAAEIEHSGQTLIVVEYEEWKTRVLKHQRRGRYEMNEQIQTPEDLVADELEQIATDFIARDGPGDLPADTFFALWERFEAERRAQVIELE